MRPAGLVTKKYTATLDRKTRTDLLVQTEKDEGTLLAKEF